MRANTCVLFDDGGDLTEGQIDGDGSAVRVVGIDHLQEVERHDGLGESTHRLLLRIGEPHHLGQRVEQQVGIADVLVGDQEPIGCGCLRIEIDGVRVAGQGCS